MSKAHAPLDPADLASQIRQMIAVLEEERQSLAALDLDGLMLTRVGKIELCEALESVSPNAVDSECRQLLQTALQLNEVNRRVRNLLAASVAARIDALAGRNVTYQLMRTANP